MITFSSPASTPPEATLILARELSRIHYDDPAARRAAVRGEFVRIRRGVYVPAAEWETLDPDARYRALCRGVVLSRANPPVLSHLSAAALWGLPFIGRPPTLVHIALESAEGGVSRNGVRGHALRLDSDDIVLLDGIPVTSLERTLVDVAATAGIYTAMAMLDHAIHLDRWGRARANVTRESLLDALADSGLGRGTVRAETRILFARTRSGSELETMSRVTMAFIGVPEPELQVTYVLDDGEVDVDFRWECVDGIGEADGAVKYFDPAMRGDRSVEQVHYDEKLREDQLRRRARGFVRWRRREALSTDGLRAALAPLGLSAGRPRLSLGEFRGRFGQSRP